MGTQRSVPLGHGSEGTLQQVFERKQGALDEIHVSVLAPFAIAPCRAFLRHRPVHAAATVEAAPPGREEPNARHAEYRRS